MQASGEGTGPHIRHCRDQERLLVRALTDRGARLATALELGGGVAPAEIQTRCEQVRELQPEDPQAARCLARLAWARADAVRAKAAFDWALPLEVSEARDQALGQAAATLLQRLGDPEAARDQLARLAPEDRGPTVDALAVSLTVYDEKLAPLREATRSEEADADAWRRWLTALADVGWFPLAEQEMSRATQSQAWTDAKLLLTFASVRTRAAAALPTGGDRAARRRRIRGLLEGARDDLDACAALDGAPPTCAQQASAVRAQLARLAAAEE